ncbi:hypothetical protein ZIOFF_070238 [Zingiber officinale]|uniref:Auxin efflux carrier component n=1 Tax=Zingiber officinale TaxID=94328 RepID=A0A8J5EQI4_ZINOF|nr:hypothetical protein ZIOFF_070238 [Zingiber officinale]
MEWNRVVQERGRGIHPEYPHFPTPGSTVSMGLVVVVRRNHESTVSMGGFRRAFSMGFVVVAPRIDGLDDDDTNRRSRWVSSSCQTPESTEVSPKSTDPRTNPHRRFARHAGGFFVVAEAAWSKESIKMISMGNLIKVAEAMLPLYMPLGLGYVSLRWWRLISPEQCQAIDRLVYSITLPLFTLQFTLHMDPFAMNYRMIAADAISKVLVAALLVAWTSCRRWLGHRDQERPSYCWAITGFSLTQLTNSLVVGVPLVTAMYGPWARDVVVQLSVVQAVVWLPLLQFVLEIRKARCGQFSMASEAQEVSIEAPPPPAARDLEGGTEEGAELAAARPSYCSLIKVVLLSLAKNPNSYACIIGITARDGHVLYWSTAQAMMLKFICGPAAMAIGAFSVGLRSEMLHLAIIQAAMPQSITSFIFAKEYELDADVLSTAVTFGMLVFLPVLGSTELNIDEHPIPHKVPNMVDEMAISFALDSIEVGAGGGEVSGESEAGEHGVLGDEVSVGASRRTGCGQSRGRSRGNRNGGGRRRRRCGRID